MKCESREEFFEEIIEKFDSVIWKSVEDSENVKFQVEGEIKERERMITPQ